MLYVRVEHSAAFVALLSRKLWPRIDALEISTSLLPRVHQRRLRPWVSPKLLLKRADRMSGARLLPLLLDVDGLRGKSQLAVAL